VAREPAWAELPGAEKRERLLAAAGEVFAREGIDAPMPQVAAAACAGVGSVYRQFPSKEDLLAALVVRRLDTVACDVEAALVGPGDAWSRFVELMWVLADRQAGDDVAAEALATVSEQPAVAESSRRCEGRFEELLAAAREEGKLRTDASVADVRMLLAAVRMARRRGTDSWQRMLELGLDGLAAAAAGSAAPPGGRGAQLPAAASSPSSRARASVRPARP
jgi:AcrR family transcriptional regulator